MKQIEIFRAGTHTALNGQTITYSTSDLAEIAKTYNPQTHHAPIVVGHPQLDSPAYGWIQGLTVKNDRLIAEADQVDDSFADLVRQGRFKKVSASFYTPDSPTNPTPGKYYLRHVGFLGAQPPAVKGLADAKFAEEDIKVTFSEDMPMTQDELEKAQKELALKQAALQAEQATFAEKQAATRAADIKSRVDGLVKDGKVLPRQQNALTALLSSFQGDQVVAFTEEGVTVEKSPTDVVLHLLASLPQQVVYSEVAGHAGTGDVRTNFKTAPGFAVDAQRRDMHAKALAYMEANKMADNVNTYAGVVARFESGELK